VQLDLETRERQPGVASANWDLRPGVVLAAARRRRRDKIFKKVLLFSSDIQVIFMHG